MKKFIALALTLVMALSLVACGGGNATPNSDGSNTGDSTELVFAHIFATDSMEDKCAKMFAEKVAEYTNGAYTVTVYPAGQLGAMAEIIEQQQVGTATFQIISTTALSSISEYAAVDSWPYMFTNREEFEKAYASDAGKEWLAKVSEETGFTLLAPMYKGIRQTFVNFDAETIDDLKGCKLRVAGLQPVLDCFTCMGVAPTPMSTSEVYTAMSQNVVEGMEIEMSTAASMALQEVTKTVMMTNHGAANYAILVPTKYYTELPADVQEAFDKAATECGTWLADQVEQQDADALKVFEDAGCKIVYPDYSAWETAAYGSYAEMYPELAKYATAMKEAAHS